MNEKMMKWAVPVLALFIGLFLGIFISESGFIGEGFFKAKKPVDTVAKENACGTCLKNCMKNAGLGDCWKKCGCSSADVTSSASASKPGDPLSGADIT